ncbi:glycosyltransferase [Nocardioides plantarum]|uniref:Glycosyltransferase n=1 Tax=Nocardioides plantarum TaxID=29299 RepID=A0ABV5K5C9_9ACTN|nr:glycosyltransferase [Nocardioides plantarum]
MSPRLHVVHVSRPVSEGTAVVALSYVRDQLERGWNVTLVCPSDGWLGYAARDLGARVRWWQSRREPTRGVLGETMALRSILAECPSDVVHLHGAKAGLVGRLAVHGRTPTFYQPHGWSFLAVDGAKAGLALRWERLAARWTDTVVCVSEDERRLATERAIDARTLVLPNGIDLAAWPRVADAERQVARDELGLDGGPVAVCVGRLSQQKGQHDLLDAWPEVHRAVPDATLVLVGDGPDRAALEARAEGLAGLRMVGARTDVRRWLVAADVVVAPSRWEGMALVPLEAMACARSIVATRAVGVEETVPDGAGAVVDLGARDDLAAALAHRLRHRDEADAEGLVGRAHVESGYDAATASAELSTVYLTRLAQRRPAPR